MFRADTLFVVGAGASNEAGLPTGIELKSQIAEMMNISFSSGREQRTGDPRITEWLREAAKKGAIGTDFHHLLVKAWAVRDGLPLALSIDNYLDAHRGDKELEFIGKLGIAKSILDAEMGGLMAPWPGQRGGFRVTGLMDTWYVRFAQLLTENVARTDLRAAVDRASVISFNYDRTIPHFLRQALSAYYRIHEEEAEEILSGLRIYHPYGKVGDLPWQCRGRGIAFGDVEGANLIEVTRQIRTFTERIQEGAALAQIKRAVQKARTTVFLGFGFHKQNMELIRPYYTEVNQTVYATVLGVSTSDQRVVRKDLEDILGEGPTRGRITQGHAPAIEFFNGTCAELLDEYRRSLTER